MDFKDYDAAEDEVEDAWWQFRFGGEDFKVNLNVDGAAILRWMRNSRNPGAIAVLLQEIMGDDYDRLLATKQPWKKYEMLLIDVFDVVGAGRGNAR